ncbi:hypothetical protein [Bordetella genomosp. 11]|uniref:Uncharacterized protein n=1 Tax=Bordetella genomosp. 11 TaxID=1416808 RepID=A0A261UI11_9BORD|nr:hypothetical protein [Bordetella genomosp. 11]OZI61578.1 hypothetical protein CAL28_20050 [Bordetella genomosp. 11]
MQTELIVAHLEAVDGVSIKPAKDGDVLQFALRGDLVAAKLAATGRRIGDIKSADVLAHLRHGGQVRGRLERTLSGPMAICTLVGRH